ARSPHSRHSTWDSTCCPDLWGECAAGSGVVITWISALTERSSEPERMRFESFQLAAIPGHSTFARQFFLTVTALYRTRPLPLRPGPCPALTWCRPCAHATPPCRFRLCIGDQPVRDWPGHDHRG